MKKCILLLLALACLLPLAGCRSGQEKTVTCAEVIAIYEEAGYEVSHRDYPEKEYGYLCQVEIEEDDGDSIHFHFYETAEEAEAEAEERQWNVLLWMFSAIYGEPTWLETETYQNIEIEYDDDDLYKPFKELLSMSQSDYSREYPQDTFFTEDVLAEYFLSGMPSPKLENSRLKENILYCNLNNEEYQDYVRQLVEYLQTRQDIYHLGRHCSWALEAEIMPYDIYSFIPEDYAQHNGGHSLVFSTQEACTKNGYLYGPIRIEIVRGEEKLGFTNFTYNTMIRLKASSRGAKFDPCYNAHSYDEGMAYPVPGLDRCVTIYKCVYCGAEDRSEYFDSQQFYAVTVTQGRNLILSNNWNQTVAWDIDSMHAGGKMEITVRNSAQGRVEMLVNGDRIPALWAAENTQTFCFIMPQEDVEIQILVVDDDPGE